MPNFPKSLYLTLLALGLALVGCKKKDDPPPASTPPPGPTARFDASHYCLEAPCAVSFFNTSENAATYSWNFGDGGTSTERSPSHTYQQGGTYTVTLTVTSASGQTATDSRTVNIPNRPATRVRVLSMTVNGYPPQTSTGANWDLTDGVGLPDVYVKLTDINNNVFVDGRSAKVNNLSTAMLPQTWTINNPSANSTFNVANLPSGMLYVDLWDADDLDADDLMGYAGFNAYSLRTERPTTLNLPTASPASVQVSVSLQWLD